MTKTQSFEPNWTSAPGDTILDIIDDKNITTEELAAELEEPPSRIEGLLEGRIALTIELAGRLEEVLGGSVEFWMTRDSQYREGVARLRSSEQEWLDELPISDMIKFGWLPSEPHPQEEVETCLRFFDVASLEAWRNKYLNPPQMAALRSSSSYETKPAALATWVRQGEIEASRMKCDSWDSDEFRRALNNLRGLTRQKDPNRFIPRLQNRCASAGVATIVLRAPTECRASGATKFLTENKALLLLSFRHLTDDHFWFTFFHEAGHLIHHGKNALHVEGLESTLSPEEEQEADDFAEDVLVPEKYREEMLSLPTEAKKIIRFARKVGVSPGIIVGQLQHYGQLDYDQMNSLKRRYTWNIDRISLRNA